ncbi:hypothetical protein CR203_03405 [Salipaludibacillus neizhouensis]|uniref:Uncharacterized protein n=1 Tax=Salipaludibacillus neizhouensis TaxID=885475 RepID=A0A3A9K9B9_9BACI|nr:hypothetical protein [Salipaludibacillus neizhouensis]RKL69097.1 hypothetical protein CR203_03405 [Salipaludibacillus neizhouensis]
MFQIEKFENRQYLRNNETNEELNIDNVNKEFGNEDGPPELNKNNRSNLRNGRSENDNKIK